MAQAQEKYQEEGILGYGSWEASLVTVVSNTGAAGHLLLLRFEVLGLK